MNPETVRGQCYCNAVRFEADLPARFVAHCHCDNCRRSSGAGLVTWAGFPHEQFRFTAGEDRITEYHTETDAVRRFCSLCGTTFSYSSPRWPNEIHLTVANLLDPLGQTPTGHAYADRAPDWCPILDDLPRYGGKTGMEPL